MIRANNRDFEIIDSFSGSYYAIVVVRRRADGWSQMVTVVYGPNRSEERTELWKEIKEVRSLYDKPWIIGGDFNIIRYGHKR